jgi:hypothetical protein
MKAKDSQKEKWSWDKIIAAIPLLESVLAIKDMLLGHPGNELPRAVFAISLYLLLQELCRNELLILKKIIGSCKYYRKERKKLRKAYDDRNANHLSCDGFGYTLDCIKRKTWKKTINYSKRPLIRIAFFLCMLIVICYFNPNNAQACWNGVLNILGINEEEQQEPTHNPQTENSETVSSQPEEQRIPKPQKYRFILDEPDINLLLQQEIEEQVYFLGNENSYLSEEYVLNLMNKIYEHKKSGTTPNTLKDDKGNTYNTFTTSEDNFKEKVSQFSKETDYKKWLENAPHSSEMEEYINGRKQLNSITVDGNTGCYELWWLLANDNQYYAQEYETQTANETAILYYYSMSIYCCMEALKYQMSEKIREDIFHYMVMRYHDICRDESSVAEIYKERAKELYRFLVKLDSKSNSVLE